MKGIKIADCQTPTILANQAKEKQQDFLAVASDLGGGEQNLLHPDPKQREEVEKKDKQTRARETSFVPSIQSFRCIRLTEELWNTGPFQK
jgi:hypothetical protein